MIDSQITKTMARNSMIKGVPNMLTAVRILLIPVLVICFYLEGRVARYVSVAIFIFASITDYIDGALAKRWGAQTNFGRMLDPIADKMLVSSILLMLVDKKMAPVFPIIAILCREFFVSGMREYLAEIKIVMRVNVLGKIKTTVQMVAVILLLLGEAASGISHAEQAGQVAIWIAACLTLISGYVYFRECISHM